MRNKKNFLGFIFFVCLLFMCGMNVSAETIVIVSNQVQEVEVYEDTSHSMKETFGWETQKLKELFENEVPYYHQVTWTEFSDAGQTNLYEVLNQAMESECDNIVIISDIWDTTGEELKAGSKKNLVFMVPYDSSNTEGMEHVQQVIQQEIAPKVNANISVCYMDGFVEAFTKYDPALDPKNQKNTDSSVAGEDTEQMETEQEHGQAQGTEVEQQDADDESVEIEPVVDAISTELEKLPDWLAILLVLLVLWWIVDTIIRIIRAIIKAIVRFFKWVKKWTMKLLRALWSIIKWPFKMLKKGWLVILPFLIIGLKAFRKWWKNAGAPAIAAGLRTGWLKLLGALALFGAWLKRFRKPKEDIQQEKQLPMVVPEKDTYIVVVDGQLKGVYKQVPYDPAEGDEVHYATSDSTGATGG